MLKKALFLVTSALLFSNCSPSKADKTTQLPKCFHAENEAIKTSFVNGIRGQVAFTNEDEVLSSIPNKLTEYNIPAVSLAVIQNGTIAWSDTYINSNFPSEQELDCHSLFQTASLSKPVTFMAALRMHVAKEIDLDAPVETYLKTYELPQGAQSAENPVTFRNIFSHTSGITPGGYMGYPKDTIMPTDLDVLNAVKGVNSPKVEVIFPPNERTTYSGGAYTLAELTIQDHFNESFSNIMHKWILEPTGMEHSEFTQPLKATATKRVANGYTGSGEMIEGGWRNHPEQAAAGLWSTASDMALFLIEIYKGYKGESSVFSQADIQKMLEEERDGLVYGFILNTRNNDLSITHYGGNMGYRTGMTISLKTGNGLVYLINSDNGGALGNELFLTASEVYQWPNFKQTSATSKKVDASILKALTGTYKWNNQIELSITYSESDNQITLFFPNGDAYKLTPVEGEFLNFIHPNTGVELSFIEGSDTTSFMLYRQKAVKMETL